MKRPASEIWAGAFVHLLASLSGRGVEERGGVFIAYFEASQQDEARVLSQTRTQLSEVSDHEPVEIQHRWQAHEDWIELWRRGLAPRRITRRLVVSPTWEETELREGELLISLDPGIAFGTAEHPTTRGCLRLLETFVEGGNRVADIGAGSGILSIATAFLGAGYVLAVDSDPWACVATRENTEVNGVSDRVDVLERSVDRHFLADCRPFDGIVANIEAGVLIPLLSGFRQGVRPDGWLILGGVLQQEREEIVRAAKDVEFHLATEDLEEQWWTGGFSA